MLEKTQDEIQKNCNDVTTDSNTIDYNTLKSAVQYGKENRIEDWVLKFLDGAGKNQTLTSLLKCEKRYYLGPVYMQRSQLDVPRRVPNSLAKENERQSFYKVVSCMDVAYTEGWDMPPLIIEYTGNRYVVHDGVHRFATFQKMGLREIPAIIWTSSEEEYDELLNNTELKIIF